MPAPRRPRTSWRSPADELALAAQAVDVLALRVAVSGELAGELRSRALGLHLMSTAASVGDHVRQRRDVVVPVLVDGEAGEPLAASLASAERVLELLEGLAPGAAALLSQTAGVSALQHLGIATRSAWAALVEHEHQWAAAATPLARRRLAERSAAGPLSPAAAPAR